MFSIRCVVLITDYTNVLLFNQLPIRCWVLLWETVGGWSNVEVQEGDQKAPAFRTVPVRRIEGKGGKAQLLAAPYTAR